MVLPGSLHKSTTTNVITSQNPIAKDVPPKWLTSSYRNTPLRQIAERFLAAALLIALAPILVVCYMIVCVTSKGPAIYSQVRVGKHGRLFRIHKFRTMVANAEAKTGAVLSWKNDPRITYVGAIFRKTHLDELPQLWNVVRGDMSFIGPRPERPHFVDKFNVQVNNYKFRHYQLPGITGLAQICAGYHAKPEEKVMYDLKYLRERDNLALNASIVMHTLLKMMHIEHLFTRIRNGLVIPQPEHIS